MWARFSVVNYFCMMHKANALSLLSTSSLGVKLSWIIGVEPFFSDSPKKLAEELLMLDLLRNNQLEKLDASNMGGRKSRFICGIVML